MASDCPSEHDLLAFHLGTLFEQALTVVGQHVETCVDCQSGL